MPALQHLLDYFVNELPSIVRVEDPGDSEVREEVLVECCTHAHRMLAFECVGKIKLGPVVNTVKDPLVWPIREMSHIDEINLRIKK